MLERRRYHHGDADDADDADHSDETLLLSESDARRSGGELARAAISVCRWRWRRRSGAGASPLVVNNKLIKWLKCF